MKASELKPLTDVLLVHEKAKKTFYLKYQSRKASRALSKNKMDDVNFPENDMALSMIKKHLEEKKLTYTEDNQ